MKRAFVILLAITIFLGVAYSSDSNITNDYLDLQSGNAVPPSEALKSFKSIAFDLRQKVNRGGRGDIAAAYLTARDMIERLGYRGKLTFYVDEKALRVLGQLVGSLVQPEKPLVFGSQLIRLVDLNRDAPTREPHDLYLEIANSEGVLHYRNDLKTGRIPLSKDAVLISQTVMGNSENSDKKNPFGMAEASGQRFNLAPAGIEPGASGIYHDVEAAALRVLSRTEIKRRLLQALETDHPLAQIAEGRLLSEAKLGLVYGVSHQLVWGQFESYLRGLAAEASTKNSALVLLTPSSFELTRVQDPELRERLRVVDANAIKSDPEKFAKSEPRTITIVKTGEMSHRVFVALMALSEIPPIVSGDGAISAAIAIGKPFVSTSVPWNMANLTELYFLLQEGVDSSRRKLLSEVFFDENLSRALEVSELPAAFEALSGKLATVTDTLVRDALRARMAANGSVSRVSLAAELRHPTLLKHALGKALRSGSAGEADFIEILRSQWPRASRSFRKEIYQIIHASNNSQAWLLDLGGPGLAYVGRLVLEETDVELKKFGIDQLRWALSVHGSETSRLPLVRMLDERASDASLSAVARNEALQLLVNAGPDSSVAPTVFRRLRDFILDPRNQYSDQLWSIEYLRHFKSRPAQDFHPLIPLLESSDRNFRLLTLTVFLGRNTGDSTMIEALSRMADRYPELSDSIRQVLSSWRLVASVLERMSPCELTNGMTE